MIDETQLQKIYDKIITHNNATQKDTPLAIIKEYIEMIKNE